MQNLTGTFDAAGEVTGLIFLQPNEEMTYSLVSAALTGSVVFEKSLKGMSAFEVLQEFSAAGGALSTGVLSYKNTSSSTHAVRLRCVALNDDDSEEVTYSLSSVAGEYSDIVYAKDGRLIYGFTYEGILHVPGGVNFPGSEFSAEIIKTNDSDPIELSFSNYKTELTTSGSVGAEDIEIVNGTELGQRKLIVLNTLTDPGDSVDMDYTNLAVTGETITDVSFDAEGEQLLLEWHGAAWTVIAASAGVVTSS